MKLFWITVIDAAIGLGFHPATAQTKVDTLIMGKYRNDTLGFTAYPATPVPASMVVDMTIAYWELNEANMNDKGFSFMNLYRTGQSKARTGGKEGDWEKKVLSQAKNGFGTICPPGWCFWYISARKTTGDTITVTDYQGLRNFMGEMGNPYSAYFWIIASVETNSGAVPLVTSPDARYKVVDNGFLVILDLRVSDCPVTGARELYFVGKDKSMVLIQTLRTTVWGGCI